MKAENDDMRNSLDNVVREKVSKREQLAILAILKGLSVCVSNGRKS